MGGEFGGRQGEYEPTVAGVDQREGGGAGTEVADRDHPTRGQARLALHGGQRRGIVGHQRGALRPHRDAPQRAAERIHGDGFPVRGIGDRRRGRQRTPRGGGAGDLVQGVGQ